MTVPISKLHRQSVELSNIYSSKSVDENNLPTVSRQLINTNQCVVASLSSIVSTLNSLSHNLSDNLQRLSNLLSINFDDEEAEADKPGAADVDAGNATSAGLEKVVVDASHVTRLEELQTEVGNLRHEIESLNEKLKKAEQVGQFFIGAKKVLIIFYTIDIVPQVFGAAVLKC